jgi:hypothetical protein
MDNKNMSQVGTLYSGKVDPNVVSADQVHIDLGTPTVQQRGSSKNGRIIGTIIGARWKLGTTSERKSLSESVGS